MTTDVRDTSAASDPRGAREAAATLLGQLSPQERAAVVLKDVFDFSLEETAEALSTTVGAIKAALHRARGKLVEPGTDEPTRAFERLSLVGTEPPTIHFLRRFNVTHLAAYFARLTERPSFARVLREAEPYMAMFPG